MNSALKIQNILGYVAHDNPLRASRDGKAFEEMLPAPVWTEEVVRRNGTVGDTVNEMRKLIFKSAWQTKHLAAVLKDKDLYSTCKNIWNFLYGHIKYKEDDEGEEQLRTPALSWAVRRTRGIDCDDFSIFVSTILYNLHIPHYLRIARYKGKTNFQHVYVVVPQSKNRYITIDPVLDQYDAEKEPIETKDFIIMSKNNLNGIDISVLGGAEDDTFNQISGIISGLDFNEIAQMQGLGQVPSEDQELEALKNHLVRTRDTLVKNPSLISEVDHPQSFIDMVNYALKYWDTDKRQQALDILSKEEDRINHLSGLGEAPEGYEEVNLFYGLNNLGTVDILGKAKAKRNFFNKIKEGIQKAGQGIKTIAKQIVKYNPVTLVARAGMLLALKVNLFKLASKLKWGYLTEQEAQQHGFDMGEWNKLRTQLNNAENLFVNILQGQADNFKSAILTGRAGGLSGTGLGVVAAAAGTAAATPFITKIFGWLKGVDYKKMLSKVNFSKLLSKRKKADIAEEQANVQATVPETTDSNNPDNLPATTDTTDARVASPNKENPNDPAQPEPGILEKAWDWIKANPLTSLTIGGVGGLLIYEIFKPKKRGLSGKRGGKKKTGKNKKHAPAVPKKKTRKKTKKKKSSVAGIKTVTL